MVRRVTDAHGVFIATTERPRVGRVMMLLVLFVLGGRADRKGFVGALQHLYLPLFYQQLAQAVHHGRSSLPCSTEHRTPQHLTCVSFLTAGHV
jgi:hypothetical protein